MIITREEKERKRGDVLNQHGFNFLTIQQRTKCVLKYENAIRRVGLIEDRFFCKNEEEVCLEGCNCDDKTCLDCKCRFECGPGCSCTFSECQNRTVHGAQKKLRNTDTIKKFRVRWFSGTKGFGVYT